jgi:hypothetical protein
MLPPIALAGRASMLLARSLVDCMPSAWKAGENMSRRCQLAGACTGFVQPEAMTSRAQAMLSARQETAMTDRPTDDQAKPPLVKALLIARYTLVIHNGMTATSEGESWRLDFTGELAEIDAALQTAGIDTTKPMLAPVKWTD